MFFVCHFCQSLSTNCDTVTTPKLFSTMYHKREAHCLSDQWPYRPNLFQSDGVKIARKIVKEMWRPRSRLDLFIYTVCPRSRKMTVYQTSAECEELLQSFLTHYLGPNAATLVKSYQTVNYFSTSANYRPTWEISMLPWCAVCVADVPRPWQNERVRASSNNNWRRCIINESWPQVCQLWRAGPRRVG